MEAHRAHHLIKTVMAFLGKSEGEGGVALALIDEGCSCHRSCCFGGFGYFRVSEAGSTLHVQLGSRPEAGAHGCTSEGEDLASTGSSKSTGTDETKDLPDSAGAFEI